MLRLGRIYQRYRAGRRCLRQRRTSRWHSSSRSSPLLHRRRTQPHKVGKRCWYRDLQISRQRIPRTRPLRAHETPEPLVCRLLLEKKKSSAFKNNNNQTFTHYTVLHFYPTLGYAYIFAYMPHLST